jgi:hypothetical protein
MAAEAYVPPKRLCTARRQHGATTQKTPSIDFALLGRCFYICVSFPNTTQKTVLVTIVPQRLAWQRRMLRKTQQISPEMKTLASLMLLICSPIVLHMDKSGAVYLVPVIMAPHPMHRETHGAHHYTFLFNPRSSSRPTITILYSLLVNFSKILL